MTNGADLFSEPSPAARALKHTRPAGLAECPHCKGTGRIPPRTLGERLRLLRANTGMLQAEVSAQVGGVISAANLGHLECDRNLNPRVDVIRALADYYGVKPGWLLDGDPEE